MAKKRKLNKEERVAMKKAMDEALDLCLKMGKHLSKKHLGTAMLAVHFLSDAAKQQDPHAFETAGRIAAVVRAD